MSLELRVREILKTSFVFYFILFFFVTLCYKHKMVLFLAVLITVLTSYTFVCSKEGETMTLHNKVINCTEENNSVSYLFCRCS